VSTDARDRLLGLHGHESYCGSRTITCQKCQKSITIKDVPVHAKIHQVTRQNQKLPPLCSNQQCTRSRANNRLGLCQYCFGPFWVTEDDPKNVKLVQRVARKLHGQMTMGCGHSWCQNMVSKKVIVKGCKWTDRLFSIALCYRVKFTSGCKYSSKCFNPHHQKADDSIGNAHSSAGTTFMRGCKGDKDAVLGGYSVYFLWWTVRTGLVHQGFRKWTRRLR
jgi:hypothetical protein